MDRPCSDDRGTTDPVPKGEHHVQDRVPPDDHRDAGAVRRRSDRLRARPRGALRQQRRRLPQGPFQGGHTGRRHRGFERRLGAPALRLVRSQPRRPDDHRLEHVGRRLGPHVHLHAQSRRDDRTSTTSSSARARTSRDGSSSSCSARSARASWKRRSSTASRRSRPAATSRRPPTRVLRPRRSWSSWRLPVLAVQRPASQSSTKPGGSPRHCARTARSTTPSASRSASISPGCAAR